VRISSVLDRHRTAVIAGGLTLSIVGALVFIPAIMDRNNRAAADSTATLGSKVSARDTRVPVPSGLDLREIVNATYGRPDCYRRPVSTCIIVHNRGPRVLLVGDSHAQALTPAFVAVARKLKLTLAVATAANCPWQEGVVEAPPRAQTNLPRTCRARQQDWYQRILPQFDPNIVVLAHRAFDDPNSLGNIRLPNDVVGLPDQAAIRAALLAATNRTLALIRAPGRKVVIVEPIPLAPSALNPLTCLSRAKYLDECRYVAHIGRTPIQSAYRSIANGTDVYALDLDRVVCPYFPICDPMVDGIVVKKDGEHITAAYSREIGQSISALLVADGIVAQAQ